MHILLKPLFPRNRDGCCKANHYANRCPRARGNVMERKQLESHTRTARCYLPQRYGLKYDANTLGATSCRRRDRNASTRVLVFDSATRKNFERNGRWRCRKSGSARNGLLKWSCPQSLRWTSDHRT